MRIEYLKEFVMLSKNLNFSITADQLYITQSVLSRHMSSLEEELGVQLLNRTTKYVALTELGEFFLNKITKIVSDYDALTEELILRQKNYKHTLRLGVNFYSFQYYLGGIPTYFDKYYPQTMITYKTGSPDELLSDLLNDELDAIITSNLPFEGHEQLSFYNIFEEPLYVMLPKAHPLAEKESLSYADLIGQSFIGVDTKNYNAVWNYISICLKKANVTPYMRTRYLQPEQAAIAVQNGSGVFIEGTLLRYLTNDSLVVLPLTGEGSRRTISVAYQNNMKTPSIAQLIDAYRFTQGGMNSVSFPADSK